MFPFTASGAVGVQLEAAVPEAEFASALEQKLAASLELVRARNLAVKEHTIACRGGILRPVMSWNLLLPIDSAEITVGQGPSAVNVSYQLAFGELLIVAAVMAGLLSVPAFMRSTPSGVVVGAVVFLTLFGGNYAIARWRFRRLIQRTVQATLGAVPKRSAPMQRAAG